MKGIGVGMQEKRMGKRMGTHGECMCRLSVGAAPCGLVWCFRCFSCVGRPIKNELVWECRRTHGNAQRMNGKRTENTWECRTYGNTWECRGTHVRSITPARHERSLENIVHSCWVSGACVFSMHSSAFSCSLHAFQNHVL